MKLFHHLPIIIALTLGGMHAATARAQSVRDLRYEITDTAIVFPESMQADVHKMQQNWYLRNYTVLDTIPTANIPAGDETLISRLQLTPTTIEMPFNPVVKSHIERYVNNRRSLVETMLGLSLYYMPIFEEALEKEGLPLELRNLPIIESALNPNAVSRAGATGLWQFMLATARGLGMEISTLVDERRDPIIASESAARYLKQLYEIFHDWSLAIAAYNCGPGNVTKALTRAGATADNPKDFWEIYYYLPAETRGYVPGFIAATYAMNHFADHGISPALAKRPILTDTVHVHDRLYFSAIANALNIPVEELRVLNPQYRKDIIPGDVRPYSLRLPSQMIYSYLMNEDSIISDSRGMGPRGVVEVGQTATSANGTYREITKWHKVARGETLAQIARKYGVTVSDIKKWNGLRSNKLQRGAKLKIIEREAIPQEPDTAATADSPEIQIEIEMPADSIEAERTPTFVDAEAAESTVEATVQPQPEPEPAPAPAPVQTTHKVRKGESLYAIARKYGVTIAAIQAANNLTDTNIKIGQRLKIPSR